MRAQTTHPVRKTLSLLLILALLVSYIPLHSVASASSTLNSTSVVDPSTADSYENMLGTDADGNRYSGRIWTDKSVFNSDTVELEDGIVITNDSDFLVVYSALGSTTSVSSTTIVGGALDVVVILDNSMSMSNAAGSTGNSGPGGSSSSSTTRLQAVTEAANELIGNILDNETSRLSVVTYSTGAIELLPLDFYEDSDSVLSVNNYGSGGGQGGGSGSGKMTATAISRTTQETAGTTNSGYQAGTNLQAGIDLAMDILLNASGTTGRAPVIIVLTDGVADTAVDTGWYEVETSGSSTDGDTVHPAANTITAGVALSTLLNAAYKTSLLEEKYGSNPTVYGIGVDLGTTSDAFVVMDPSTAFNSTFSTLSGTAYDWYDQWLKGTDYTQSESVTSQNGGGNGNSTTYNWDYSLPSGLTTEQAQALKTAISANINYVDHYYNVTASGTELSDAFDKIVTNMNQSVFHPITDTVIIGGTEASSPLTFVDFIGEYMEVKDIKAVTLFGQQYGVTAGATSTVETDNGDGTYTITATTTFIVGNADDTVTHPIMNTTASIGECVTIELVETYTAIQTDDAFVKHTVSDQRLWIYIKETALPLIYTQVVDNNGSVTYTQNDPDPIRVYYTVGITDDIKAEDGTVMTSRISADYLEANTNADGTVNFYANQYGEMNAAVNGVVSNGDAHASATPSQENRYYYHQANQGIFTAVTRTDGGEIQWDTAEYGVLWNSTDYELTWMTYAQYQQYNADLALTEPIDHQVYTYVEFYRPTSVDGAGEKVSYLVYTNWSLLRNCITFYDFVNKVYVNYDPDTNTISVGEQGYYIDLETLPEGVTIDSIINTYVSNVATYVGENAKSITTADVYAMLGINSLRLSRLNNMVHAKTENVTGTAVNHYAPSRDTNDNVDHVGSLVVWQGNNGKLALDPTQGISLTKVVTEASTEDGAPTTFTFEVTITADTEFDPSAIAVMDRYGNLIDGWTVSSASGSVTDAVISGSLTDGQTVYIVNLPAGASYKVEETNAGDFYDYEVQSGTVTNNAITAVSISNDAKDYGNLYITKDVIHSQAGQSVPASMLAKEFTLSVNFGTALAGKTFTVIHSGDSELTSVTVDADGINEFTIKHGETIEVFHLPAGTEVTVAEGDPGTNFAVSYRSRNHSGEDADNNGTVTIPDSANATVVVTNAYAPTPTTVDLDIDGTKKFTIEGSNHDGGTFTFQVQQWNGSAWVDISGKTASVTYGANESGEKYFTIENVLAGIEYTQVGFWAYQVLEVIPAEKIANVTYDRTLYTFTVTVTDNGGELVATVTDVNNALITDKTYEVSFTNTYHTAPISMDIVKIVENKSGDNTVSKAGFKFKSKAVDAEGNALNPDAGETATNAIYTDAAGEARVSGYYDKAGTYYYIVWEDNSGALGWTYSQAEYFITVVVTDDGTGNLSSKMTIEPWNDAAKAETAPYVTNDNEGHLYFTNTYDPADTSIALDVNKTLTGRAATAQDEFNFRLYLDVNPDHIDADEHSDQYLVLNGSVTGSGKVAFTDANPNDGFTLNDDGELIFTKVGTYNFDLLEVKGTLSGITYDETVYDLVVIVTDEGGWLKATAYYEDDTDLTIDFVNTYTITGTATLDLSGEKTLEGRDLAAGEFTFQMVVTDENRQVVRTSTTANHADGSILFPTITYTAAHVGHTYTYTITELYEGKGGITYSNAEYVITVKVLDDGKGGIALVSEQATITGTSAAYTDLNFANTYNAKKAEASISASKTLTGVDYAEYYESGKRFTFGLYEDGELVKTVDADETGKVTFGLTYTSTGFHTYTVKEIVPEGAELVNGFYVKDGVTYSNAEYTVTVHVTDDGHGQLSAYVAYVDGALSFTNAYSRESALVTITGNKELTGRDLEEGEFTFGIYRADEDFNVLGDALRTVSNAADGTFAFLNGTFSAPGTYYYVIAEIDDGAHGVRYDETAYHVTIVVEDNVSFDGKMTTTTIITYEDGTEVDGPISFTNTYEDQSNNVILSGSKELTGRNLEDGEFTFVLSGDDLTEDVTVTNVGNTITFPALTYDQDDIGKTFTYTVIEKNDGKHGVSYDDTEYTVTVTVTYDSETGEVIATASENYDKLDFDNGYEDESNEVVLSGKKDLTGRDLKEGEFSFQLLDEEGSVIETVTNAAGGAFSFAALSYDQDDIGKTFTYTVIEKNDGKHGVSYDDTKYTVTVTVTYDSETGEVIATASENYDKLDFDNGYEDESNEVVLSGKKDLTGRDLKEGEFSFQLLDEEGSVIETVTNAAGGAFSFAALSYDQDDIGKTFTYTVIEKNDGKHGVSYDDTKYTVTVTVTYDSETGEVIATASENYDKLDFDNGYADESNEVVLSGKKDLTGRDLKEGEFSFQLLDKDGSVIETVTNAAGGAFSFAALSYDQDDIGKTFTYTVIEKNDGKHGVSYDETKYTVTVTVTYDSETGEVIATASENYDKLDFDNGYADESNEVVLSGKKDLTGRDLKEGEFSFQLLDKDGSVIETVTNAAGGAFSFAALSYDQDDIGKTFTYTVIEKNDGKHGVSYDDTKYTVTVTVTYDSETGEVVATASENHTKLDFDNGYADESNEVVLSGEKKLDGRDLVNGEFSFILSGGSLEKDVIVSNVGKAITFPALVFTQKDIGKTYTYTVKEVIPEGAELVDGVYVKDGVTYDGTVYTVTVTVTYDSETGEVIATASHEALVFSNSYTAPQDPVTPVDPGQTGDHNLLTLWLTMMTLSGCGLAAVICGKKKAGEEE